MGYFRVHGDIFPARLSRHYVVAFNLSFSFPVWWPFGTSSWIDYLQTVFWRVHVHWRAMREKGLSFAPYYHSGVQKISPYLHASIGKAQSVLPYYHTAVRKVHCLAPYYHSSAQFVRSYTAYTSSSLSKAHAYSRICVEKAQPYFEKTRPYLDKARGHMAAAADAVASKLPAPPAPDVDPNDIGSIAAGFIAAFLFLGIALWLAVYFLRRYRRRRAQRKDDEALRPGPDRSPPTDVHPMSGTSDGPAEPPPAAAPAQAPEPPAAAELPSAAEPSPAAQPVPLVQLPYYAPAGPVFMMMPHPDLSATQAWAEGSARSKEGSPTEARPSTGSASGHPAPARFSYGQWERTHFPRPMAGFRAPDVSGQSYEPFSAREESAVAADSVAEGAVKLESSLDKELGDLDGDTVDKGKQKMS